MDNGEEMDKLLLIVVSYDPLYFCVVCCDLSIFISNFIDLIFPLCFLMSLANGLSILFILSKNQLLALLIFAMVSYKNGVETRTQNNKVNGNGIILINNYLKRKWIECPNQKTKTG